MELKRFGKYHEVTQCPHCDAGIECSECYTQLQYCNKCGKETAPPETFLIFSQDRYGGADSLVQDTVTLMINGKALAYAHINKHEEDKSADVAHLQLGYIDEHNKTEQVASIISDFAKWLRFEWNTADKQAPQFPTILVRLIGYKTHKNRPHPYQLEQFVALQDATKITLEHLARDFTSIEVIQ